MGAGLGLLQLIFRTAGNDLLLVFNIAGDQFLEAQQLRLATDDGDHVHAEGDLQVRILVQISQHPQRIHIALQFNDSAHTGPVTLIADIIDAAKGDLFILAEFVDLLQHGGLVDLVRDFRDNEQLSSGSAFLNVYPRTQGELSLTGFISAADFFIVEENAAGGEVRAGKDFHQIVQ